MKGVGGECRRRGGKWGWPRVEQEKRWGFCTFWNRSSATGQGAERFWTVGRMINAQNFHKGVTSYSFPRLFAAPAPTISIDRSVIRTSNFKAFTATLYIHRSFSNPLYTQQRCGKLDPKREAQWVKTETHTRTDQRFKYDVTE